jgi:hypothetical protein
LDILCINNSISSEKQKENAMRIDFTMRRDFTIVVLVLITVVSALLSLVSFWLGPVSFLALAYVFVYNALQKIPAKPPHKAILMFWGRRLGVVLDEGWNWIPLCPFLFDFALIKVEKINTDFPAQRVRTPDRAEVSVSESLTWMPGIKEKPESYITYLNSGGQAGVEKILRDTIEDRVKTWATSNREGPSTWMEAQGMRDDVHAVLVKSLLGSALSSVNSPIPTGTWMRFFEEPQSEPSEYDATPRNGWASKDKTTGVWNWDGLKAIFDGYSPADQSNLKREIGQRKSEVKRLREGKGDFGEESLGITVFRFSVNEVRVEGEVANAAELEEKERRERDADKMEIDNVCDRVKKLRTDLGIGPEEALKTLQVERGKASKTIIDVSGAKTDVGNDLLGLGGMLKEILGRSREDSGKGTSGGGGSGSGASESKKKPWEMGPTEVDAAYDRMKKRNKKQ